MTGSSGGGREQWQRDGEKADDAAPAVSSSDPVQYSNFQNEARYAGTHSTARTARTPRTPQPPSHATTADARYMRCFVLPPIPDTPDKYFPAFISRPYFLSGRSVHYFRHSWLPEALAPRLDLGITMIVTTHTSRRPACLAAYDRPRNAARQQTSEAGRGHLQRSLRPGERLLLAQSLHTRGKNS